MKKSLLLICVLITILLTNCKKKEKETPQATTIENILNENSHIVDITSVSSATVNSLVLQKSALGFTPKAGDIILASPSKEIPQGVMAKILMLQDDGTTIRCSTELSNLNDAFKQLHIDFKYNSDYNEDAQYKTTKTKLTSKFPSNHTIAAGFYINGQLQLNIPDVAIKYVKYAGSTFPDTVSVIANINTEGSYLEMKADGSVSVPEKTLYTYNKLPIIEVPVVIGGIPLIIPFWQYVELNSLPLNITGKMRYVIRPNVSATLGIGYFKGEIVNQSGFTKDLNADELIKTDFDADVKTDITFFSPVYKIGPFWDPTLNIFLKLSNSLYGKIQTHVPNYTVNYRLDGEVGANWQFFLGINGHKSIKRELYSGNILSGNFESWQIKKIDVVSEFVNFTLGTKDKMPFPSTAVMTNFKPDQWWNFSDNGKLYVHNYYSKDNGVNCNHYLDSCDYQFIGNNLTVQHWKIFEGHIAEEGYQCPEESDAYNSNDQTYTIIQKSDNSLVLFHEGYYDWSYAAWTTARKTATTYYFEKK